MEANTGLTRKREREYEMGERERERTRRTAETQLIMVPPPFLYPSLPTSKQARAGETRLEAGLLWQPSKMTVEMPQISHSREEERDRESGEGR